MGRQDDRTSEGSVTTLGRESSRKATQAATTVSDKGDTHNGRLGELEREVSFAERVQPRPLLDEGKDRTGARWLLVRRAVM